MTRRFCHVVAMVVVIATVNVVSGCRQGRQSEGGPEGGKAAASVAAKDSYNPHDMPITGEQKAQLKKETARFSDAVTRIKEFRVAIEQETLEGIPENPNRAHQALDQVDLVLQWLPQIARDSEVPKEQWEEMNTTANDLRTSFEKVHQNIDNKQEPDFAAVAAEVDAKIAVLEEIAKTQPSGVSK